MPLLESVDEALGRLGAVSLAAFSAAVPFFVCSS